MTTLRASATPQQEKYKTCSKCRRSKPVSMFYKNRARKNGKARQKRTGFTQEIFETALLLQKGRCAICSDKLNLLKQIHADHNHLNKKPRGVLCARCNLGLGSFKDSSILLKAAIEYLCNPPLALLDLV